MEFTYSIQNLSLLKLIKAYQDFISSPNVLYLLSSMQILIITSKKEVTMPLALFINRTLLKIVRQIFGVFLSLFSWHTAVFLGLETKQISNSNLDPLVLFIIVELFVHLLVSLIHPFL